MKARPLLLSLAFALAVFAILSGWVWHGYSKAPSWPGRAVVFSASEDGLLPHLGTPKLVQPAEVEAAKTKVLERVSSARIALERAAENAETASHGLPWCPGSNNQVKAWFTGIGMASEWSERVTRQALSLGTDASAGDLTRVAQWSERLLRQATDLESETRWAREDTLTPPRLLRDSRIEALLSTRADDQRSKLYQVWHSARGTYGLRRMVPAGFGGHATAYVLVTDKGAATIIQENVPVPNCERYFTVRRVLAIEAVRTPCSSNSECVHLRCSIEGRGSMWF